MKIYLGKGFLLALGFFVIAELATNILFKDKASGLSSFGFDADSGIVDHADGHVEFLRSWGRRFYDQKMASVPADNVFRIFTMGDSVPRSKPLENSYAWLLRKMLAEDGVDAESLNLAIPGYGSRRIQNVIGRTLCYQPDLVILHLNHSNEFEDERDFARYQSLKSWHPRNWVGKVKVFQKLRQQKWEKLMWRYLPREALALGGGVDFEIERAASGSSEKAKVWEDRTKRVTAASVGMLRDGGVKVLILTQCHFSDGKLSRIDSLEELAVSLVGEDVRHLSMFEVFHSVDAGPHFADGSHLRPSGHELLAEALAPMIKEMLQ